MKTALVFGGTRFFGRNLVEALLSKGVEVTVATRQSSPDPFGDRVKRIKVDRFDGEALKEALAGKSWDIAFDQLCYTSIDAEIMSQALEGKIKRYVFTSSGAVYDRGPDLNETAFDPYTYALKMVKADEVSYGEGKRQAEAYYFQKGVFPVVALRIPIVLGMDDYTERLLHYIKAIHHGESVYFVDPSVEMRFIHQKEAGDFLAWIGDSDYEGPINACATGVISMESLMHQIGDLLNKEVIITTEEEKESPYGVYMTRYLNTDKAAGMGFSFTALQDWLPQLIRDVHETIK